jgi:hypothetical protein
MNVDRHALACSTALALCLCAATPASADAITDPVGDFLATFTGPHNADLDVTGFSVSLSGTTFNVHTELAGDVGQTTDSLYVYGINRGAGFADFSSIGHGGVKFDAVALFAPGGSGNIILDIATNTVVGTINPIVNGNIIDFTLDSTLLSSLGLPIEEWGWNLWPRAGLDPTVDSIISDFAPDNSTIKAVPEPSSLALLLGGFAMLGGIVRRTRKPQAAMPG